MAVTLAGGKYAAATLVTSTLNGAITSGSTSIVLTSAASFSASGSIVIEGEEVAYTGKSANTLTGCSRGQNGTTAAAHSSGVSARQGTLYRIFVTAATFTQADFQLNPRLVSLEDTGQTVIRGIA
jgi:hypothetical protein